MSAASTSTAVAPPRGRTTVAGHAVERIAVRALSEVDAVGPAVRASAHVTGDEVSLAVRLSVRYPRSVRDTTRAAREHLVDRVGALTGLTVSSVDIAVTELARTDTPHRRVL